MDLKSLSAFMQTSLTYQCTSCELYFGSEGQLVQHHKKQHSKRYKVSVSPELSLRVDDEYNEPSQLSPSRPIDERTDKRQSENQREEKGESSSTNTKKKGNSDSNLEAVQQFKDNKVEGDIGKNLEDYEGPSAKRSRVETSSKSVHNIQDENKDYDDGNDTIHQYSDSMKEKIEQGHYGFLTEKGFRRFSLEELKKFAVQVVALFKLDESQQNYNLQSQPIPVIQNDITGRSVSYTSQKDLIPGCSSGNTSDGDRGMMSSTTSELTNSGSNPDDPNKSCYKCGEPGHFAWGCTNPRNREIQPKRKRVNRRRKKTQQTEESTIDPAPSPFNT